MIHPGKSPIGVISVKITQNYHTCTCIFPDNRIAIVHIQGARNQKEARASVRSVWYPYQYDVQDGDPTQGHAQPFYLRLKGERT